MMIGTNPKLLYNRRKLLLLAAKGGVHLYPLNQPLCTVMVINTVR